MRFTISTSELKSLYLEKNDDLLIIDSRPYSDYALGHLPNAINIELAQFHWIDTSKEGISQFNKQMAILLSNIGVTKNKFVVFYDDISGMFSARGVWLLVYFSHNKTAMLDGGFSKWKKEGLKIETKSNSFVHSFFRGKPNPKVLADYEYIKSKIKRKSNTGVILDSRSKSEYEGSEVRAAEAGHIPSAINIDWNNNIKKNGVFKQKAELEKWLASEKFSKQKKVKAVTAIYDSLLIPALAEQKIKYFFEQGFACLDDVSNPSDSNHLKDVVQKLIDREA